MGRYLPLFLFAVALAIVVYWLARPRYAFVVRVRAGGATLTRGKVDDDYLEDIEQICKLWGFSEGVVKGVREGGGIKIRCAGGIPKSHTQAFQNAWNVR